MKTNAGSTLYGHDGAYSRENVNTRERAKVRASSCTAMNAHDHRCADCGQHVYALDLREGRAVLAHCSDTVLCWSARTQSAALYVVSYANVLARTEAAPAWMKHLEQSINETERDVADLAVPTPRGNAVLTVGSLLRQWRGLPERGLFATEPPQAPAIKRPSLY